jgi:hypothetical protein
MKERKNKNKEELTNEIDRSIGTKGSKAEKRSTWSIYKNNNG